MKALQATLTDDVLSGATSVTVTDTGTGALFTEPIKGTNELVAVQVNITKTSGTLAGSVVLQGSLDGTNFVNIGSAFTVTNVASQSTFFFVPKASNGYTYFKVLDTGSGTGVRVTSANWKVRK